MKRKLLTAIYVIFPLLSLSANTLEVDISVAYSIDKLQNIVFTTNNLLPQYAYAAEGKTFLVVMGQSLNQSKKTLHLHKDDIYISQGNASPIGEISYSCLIEMKNQFRIDTGKSFFSFVFVVDKDISSAQLNIDGALFEVSDIQLKEELYINIPGVKVIRTQFLDQLVTKEKFSSTEVYFDNCIIPVAGKILLIEIEATFDKSSSFSLPKAGEGFTNLFSLTERGSNHIFPSVGVIIPLLHSNVHLTLV